MYDVCTLDLVACAIHAQETGDPSYHVLGKAVTSAFLSGRLIPLSIEISSGLWERIKDWDMGEVRKTVNCQQG